MKVKLSDIPTTAPEGASKKGYKAETERLVKRLGELQNIMYAEGKYSMLVVLQGMD
jgi:polyphosphate kinase 2 (PPK2 family)